MRNKKLRNTYLEKGINAIPRLLSLMDRNKYSKTYGCMDRNFWLDKSIDFPSSIMNFGTHALAIVYSKKLPNNPYYKNKKLKEWIIASMNYWTKIQHNDGSYDEFYPNERGWAGPTGFLLYSMMSSYELLNEKEKKDLTPDFLKTCEKAALYLAKYDEHGVLSNHHAMALLPIYQTYKITKNKELIYNFKEKWELFKSYQSKEGWFLEYDGADLGYLSATVSFLAKLYKYSDDWLKQEILQIVPKAIEFSSYFAYPNNYYAGTIGSRQTLHFYSHGYEFFGKKIPLAKEIAEKMLKGLFEGKLVPPEIMPDRYFVYRVPEMLLSYMDYYKTNNKLKKIPYEKSNFTKYFEHSKILIINKKKYYAVINATKGGIVKIFDKKTKKLIENDCGCIGKLTNNKIISTQWVSQKTKIIFADNKLIVEQLFYYISNLQPTPFKFLLLRLVMLIFGNTTKSAYWLKGVIRNMIILKNKPSKNKVIREIRFTDNDIIVNNKITIFDKITKLSIGGEFSVRYVPQSLYYQLQEKNIIEKDLTKEEISELNKNKKIEINSVERKW